MRIAFTSRHLFILILILILSSILLVYLNFGIKINQNSHPNKTFNGDMAYEHIKNQMKFGPRYLGSEGHGKTRDMIINILKSYGWKIMLHESYYKSEKITNILATMGEGEQWLLIGAHYDTRIFADKDPLIERRNLPVPGANDGASGVSVLLELARILPAHNNDHKYSKITLAFFDAEDNGDINGWEWIVGSANYVSDLNTYPENVVVVDMVGDRNLEIYQEGFSNVTYKQKLYKPYY